MHIFPDIKNDIKYDKNDAQISEFISNLNYDYSKSNKIKNGDRDNCKCSLR